MARGLQRRRRGGLGFRRGVCLVCMFIVLLSFINSCCCDLCVQVEEGIEEHLSYTTEQAELEKQLRAQRKVAKDQRKELHKQQSKAKPGRPRKNNTSSTSTAQEDSNSTSNVNPRKRRRLAVDSDSSGDEVHADVDEGKFIKIEPTNVTNTNHLGDSAMSSNATSAIDPTVSNALPNDTPPGSPHHAASIAGTAHSSDSSDSMDLCSESDSESSAVHSVTKTATHAVVINSTRAVDSSATILSAPATVNPTPIVHTPSAALSLENLASVFSLTIPADAEDAQVAEYNRRVALRDAQLATLDLLALPGNPLDIIIDNVGGPRAVAEMTGRKNRIVRDETGKLVYMSRNDQLDCSMAQRNIVERDLFQQGQKHVAIISEVASAGISLHADRRVGNQRRRVHITLELPWSADRAVQQLGRSHRSNQSSGPEYYLLISPQGGERRFAAAVAKRYSQSRLCSPSLLLTTLFLVLFRLESLGALTQGDRAATVGAKNMSITDFNFDTKYGKKVSDLVFSDWNCL